MSSFGDDFGWQLKFLPTICRLVGPHLLVQAPMELDRSECADLIVLTARDMRIGARVRRQYYRDRYPRDITFRSKRDSGARTEWAKITEDGFGDWMFYGLELGRGIELDPFYIIDLDVVRELWDKHEEAILYQVHKPNGDGTYFHVMQPGEVSRRYGRRDLLIAWGYHERADGQTDLFDAARPREAA